MEFWRNILVEDASGARFVAYEFTQRRFLMRRSRFELDTGEALQLVGANTFVVVATGERLVRVQPART